MPMSNRAQHWMIALAATALFAAGCGDAGEASPPADDASARVSAVEMTRGEDAIAADMSLNQLCRDRFGDIEPVEGLRVGLMTDSGSINDGTFNQFAYEGMQAAARCFGLETTYLASGASDDFVAHLEDLVAQDLDAIITVGFPLTEATTDVAERFPDVDFIGIDQSVDTAGDNYARVTFRDDQAGFLAGAAAGLLTESGTVGVIAGPDSVPPVVALANGFEAGVAHVADGVKVLRAHIDSFSDQEAGALQAQEFDRAGADVIFAPAGMTGTGAIKDAAQRGAWVIGVDQDQYLTTFEGGQARGADRIATSSVKRVDLGVFLQLADLAAGSFRGGPVALDAATGGVTYAEAHGADIDPRVHERLEEIRLGLASGDIEATSTDTGAAADDE